MMTEEQIEKWQIKCVVCNEVITKDNYGEDIHICPPDWTFTTCRT